MACNKMKQLKSNLNYWKSFGCILSISIDFYDFISPFSPCFWFWSERYIKHARSMPSRWGILNSQPAFWKWVVKLTKKKSVYRISNNICLLFLFRDFYVTVRDDSGARSEPLCGQRDTLTFLAQKLHIDYKSTRYTFSWSGFQARYQVIDESIINGKENNTSLTYMTLVL